SVWRERDGVSRTISISNKRMSSISLSRIFLTFADQALGSPMYQDLARRVAEDSDLLDLAAQAQPGQPAPNLLFAAVNFLLYKGTSHELRNFYPNHGGAYDPHRTFDPFKDFCLTHN